MKLADWSQVLAKLDSATCMWQDLDGFHLDQAPDRPPLTSIMWAWCHANSPPTAFRLRLDGDVFYLASIPIPAEGWREFTPWGDRGEVAGAKTLAGGRLDPTTQTLRHVADDGAGLAPIPFYWLEGPRS